MKYLQISEATCAFFDDCMGRKKKSFIEHNTGSKEGESVEEREKGGGGVRDAFCTSKDDSTFANRACSGAELNLTAVFGSLLASMQ